MTSNDRIQRINAVFKKRREESRRLIRGLAFKAGRHWAMTDDHVTQLGRLEKLRDPNDGSLANKFVPRGNDRRDALTMNHSVVETIDAQINVHRLVVASLELHLSGKRPYCPEQV